MTWPKYTAKSARFERANTCRFAQNFIPDERLPRHAVRSSKDRIRIAFHGALEHSINFDEVPQIPAHATRNANPLGEKRNPANL